MIEPNKASKILFLASSTRLCHVSAVETRMITLFGSTTHNPFKPQYNTVGSHTCQSLARLQDFSKPKVGEFDVVVVIKENVLWFEVTVDDALAMHMCQCFKQLPHDDPETQANTQNHCIAIANN